jgi:hypothetical protein
MTSAEMAVIASEAKQSLWPERNPPAIALALRSSQ